MAFKEGVCVISAQLANAIEEKIKTGNINKIQQRIKKGLSSHLPLSQYYGLPVIRLALQCDMVEKQKEFLNYYKTGPSIRLNPRYPAIDTSTLKSCRQREIYSLLKK